MYFSECFNRKAISYIINTTKVIVTFFADMP